MRRKFSFTFSSLSPRLKPRFIAANSSSLTPPMRVEKQCVRYGIFSHALNVSSPTPFSLIVRRISAMSAFSARRGFSIFGSGMDLRLTIIPSYFCFTRS